MKVHIQGGEARSFDGGPARVWEVLHSLDENPAGVIVSRNGRVIPEDTVLGKDDEILVIRVSHGG